MHARIHGALLQRTKVFQCPMLDSSIQGATLWPHPTNTLFRSTRKYFLQIGCSIPASVLPFCNSSLQPASKSTQCFSMQRVNTQTTFVWASQMDEMSRKSIGSGLRRNDWTHFEMWSFVIVHLSRKIRRRRLLPLWRKSWPSFAVWTLSKDRVFQTWRWAMHSKSHSSPGMRTWRQNILLEHFAMLFDWSGKDVDVRPHTAGHLLQGHWLACL